MLSELTGDGGGEVGGVRRGVQGGRRWRGEPGALDRPAAPQAPPLLDPLAPGVGLQPVQMPGLHDWGRGDGVLEHVKYVPGGGGRREWWGGGGERSAVVKK